MIRALTVAALAASLPAWAVGEHISVTGPAKEQLKETLCISMECKAGADFTVSSRVVGSQMELKVSGPSGTRFTTLLPLNGDGRLSNSDAMTATSQLVQAIESPAPQKAEKAALEKPAKKPSKWAKAHASKRKFGKAIRVASASRF